MPGGFRPAPRLLRAVDIKAPQPYTPAVILRRRITTVRILTGTEGLPEVGSSMGEAELSPRFHLRLSREPVDFSRRLVFVRESASIGDPEAGKLCVGAGGEAGDALLDDSALA
ncbi:MAG: hypothetical protein AB1714_05460 [Acidobacteriota bacterium]